MVLNAVWLLVFFGLHRLGTGFLLIVAMLAAAAATTWAFFQCSQAAGLLMLPYLVWIAYAAALNLAIWIGNPAVRTR